MAFDVGDLSIKLGVDAASLQADMNKALGVFGRGMKDMQDAATHVGNQLGWLLGGQMIQSLDLLARRGVEAFGVLKRSAIDAADELNKMSQKVGFSVESLSALKYAASLSDVSLEGLGKGLKGLSQNMAEARGGSKEMAALFGKLGISLDSSDEALLQLADRFARMPDGFEKTALAVKLFGKAGMDMIPFLNQGRDGIAQLTDEAKRFGVVIDGENGRQAEAFNDNLTRLSASAQGLLQILGNAMIPTLLDVTDALLDAKTVGGGFDDQMRAIIGTQDEVESAMETTAQAFANVYSMMMPVIVGGRLVYDVFKGIALEGAAWAAQIVALKEGNIAGLKEIGIAAEEDAAKLRKSSDEFIASIVASANGANETVAKFFEEHRRTVRVGNQKYLMESVEDAKKLQAAIAAVYKEKPDPAATGVLGGGSKQALAAEIDQMEIYIGMMKQAEKELKALAKAREDQEKSALDAAYAEAAASLRAEEALTDKIEQLEFETTLIGLSNTERERAIMLHELEAQKLLLSADAYEELRTRMEAALATKIDRQKIQDGIDENQKAWERSMEQIGQSLTDELMRGGQNAGELLQNYFKTLVLRPIIQGVVSAGMNAVGLGGGSSSGSSLFSTASTANSLYTASQGGGMYGSFAASSAGEFLGLSNTAGAVMDGATVLTELGSTIGTLLPWAAAALVAIQVISSQLTGGTPHEGGAAFSDSNLDFNATAGRAETEAFFNNNSFQGTDWFKSPEISAALEPVAAAFADTLNAVRNRYGLSDAQVGFGFSADGEDPSRGVALAQAGTGNPLLASYERFDEDAQKGMQEFVGNLSEYMITALAASDLSDPINAYLDKFAGTISEGAANAVAAALNSDWIDPFLEQLDVVGLSFDEITSEIVKFSEVATLKPLFDALSIDIYDFGADIANAFGGAQNAGAAMSAYYDAFYTEAEKTEALTAQVSDAFADLNLAMPDSREGFRAIVESLDLTTQAGINTYSALLNLAPAFATLTDAVKTTQAEINKATGEFLSGNLSADKTWAMTYSSSDPNTPTGRTMVDLVLSDEALQRAAEKEGARLVQSIFNKLPAGASAGGYSVPYRDPGAPLYSAEGIELVNQGYTNEAMALSKLLAATTDDATGIDYAANGQAYKDQQSEVQMLIDTMRAEEEAATLSMQSWQDQLDVLNGTRTQSEVDLANALIDADDATAELIEQVYALTAAQEAERIAAETAERIADERYGLETALLQLQDDTAALRARELALLDTSNTALQEQIWALEDQQTAAEEAAQAAEELASAWESITDSLLDQIDQIRGTMAEESVDSVAALQARFAITTAQARAGDQTAAENLAEYAAQLSANISADNTGSQIEMILAQAQIAESLQTTADLLNGGTINPLIAPLPTVDSNAAVAQAVTDLSAEIVILHQRLSEIQTNTRRTAEAARRTARAVNGNPDQPIPVETV